MFTDTVWLLFVGMYPLSFINKRLVEIIGACYSYKGIINGTAAVYSPYSSKSEKLCSSNNQVRHSARLSEMARRRDESIILR